MRPLLVSAIAPVLASLVASCASYDGHSLVPGQSSAAQVEALMGRPAEKITNKAGETVWFYPHAPVGRDTFAVRMRPDGSLIAVEQRLTKENAARVVPGMTVKEVRELFGPPSQIWQGSLMQRDVWDYPMLVDNRLFDFYVQFSTDGIVREAYLLHDPIYDAGTLP
jgi:hypothetical protein